LVKLGVEIFFFKIPIGRTIFKFSFKTSGFCGAGWIFWSIFCQFFVIFSSKTWVFSGAGWSFWVKKTLFFCAKLHFLRGWMLFLGTFLSIFLSFCHAKFLFFASLRGLFESKKTIFFMRNFSFCGAGCSFWVQKRQLIEIF